MANIDSQSDIEITFNRPIITISKIGKSINPIEIQKSYLRADICYSEHAISISFSKPLAGAHKRFELRISCEPLALQLSSMALVCKSLSGSALLLGVEHLHLSAERPPSSGQDGSERKGWLEIIHHFRGTKWVHVAGDHSTNIVLALQLSNSWREIVLPSLHKLYIQEPKQHHLPLREAVSAYMHSRQLSGSLIGVEYEQLWVGDEQRGTGPSQRSTIDVLCDDVLLNIFFHCQEASPKFWTTLVHVCRSWRQVVFTSPRSLHLRLYCEHGTPVSETLGRWPALPIIVQYGGSSTVDPPAPEDEDNVLAALKQSNRVSSISLTITDSLLAKLFTIVGPFPELEELDILSPGNVQLTLPNIFQWGPRLRSLHLTRIAIPSPLQLSSSTDLVDLQLYEIPTAGYMAPEAFANALSGMTQLRSLSLDFLSPTPRPNLLDSHSSSGEYIALPALARLKYRGSSRYLDNLVARIDTPRLEDVDVTFFYERTMHVWRLGLFTKRIEMQRSVSQADIVSSESAISIRFTQPDAPTRFGLRILCEWLDLQLGLMGQTLIHFPHFLHRVENLGINTTELSRGEDGVGGEHWLGLIRVFGSTKDFRVAGEHVTDILCALRLEDWEPEEPTVLPALCDLRVLRKPLSIPGPSWDAVQSLYASRWRSGRPVHVHVAQYSCRICDDRFKDQRGLQFHLKVMHAYRIVCLYCRDFKWSRHQRHLFREHLESKHPEVPHIPEHSSSSHAWESLTTVKPPRDKQRRSRLPQQNISDTSNLVPPSPEPALTPTDA